jgi:hypothetical protein
MVDNDDDGEGSVDSDFRLPREALHSANDVEEEES